MNPAEIQQTLQTAITLVRQGQKEQGRHLLLQVVEADEQNEIAWLWLAAVVTLLDDQITALENVLVLNPHNHSAQKGLAQLRAQQPETVPPSIEESIESEIGETTDSPPSFISVETDSETTLDPDWLTNPTQPAEPESDSTWGLNNYTPPTPSDSVTALDDPYQCVYCGAIAAATLKRCPECGRNLMVFEGSNKLSASLRSAVFVVMASVTLMVSEAIVLVIFSYQGQGRLVNYIFTTLNLDLLFGTFSQWTPATTQIITWIQLTALGLLLLVMLGLLYQITLAYYFSILFMPVNTLWVIYRWITGYIGPVIGIPDILLSIFALFFIFAAQPDFQVNATRLRCAIAAHVKGGDSLNRLGHIAKGKGQWALAVAYWRAAVAAMPNQPGFYKDLAIGYAQIGYYQKAFSALNEFAHQSSDATDFAPMKTLIEAKQAKDQYPRG